MRETDDPLLDGDVEPPPGTEITDPDQISPERRADRAPLIAGRNPGGC